MRQRPLAAVWNLKKNDSVKIRLKETDKWINGTVDSIDRVYNQIFVKAGKFNYQFELTEYPELICK